MSKDPKDINTGETGESPKVAKKPKKKGNLGKKKKTETGTQTAMAASELIEAGVEAHVNTNVKTVVEKKRTRKKSASPKKVGVSSTSDGTRTKAKPHARETTSDQLAKILGTFKLGGDEDSEVDSKSVAKVEKSNWSAESSTSESAKNENDEGKNKTERKELVEDGEEEFAAVLLTDEGMIQSRATAIASRKDFFELRVAVVGNVDSGKSTLVGVLTGGQNDDGRGKARAQVVVHQHEASSGRTSCISQHIVGFDSKGGLVHQTVAQSANAAAKDKGWRKVIANSRSIMTFIDLAGHEKYLKTTIAGLTGCFPEYAMIIVNSLAGITKMTKEHLGVVLALHIPFTVVVTKLDMVPENVLAATKKQLWRALRSEAVKKMPINVRSESDLATIAAAPAERLAPVFFISSVTGQNIGLLTKYLSQLKPRQTREETKEVEFTVDHTFNVPGVGIVVSGTLKTGSVATNQNLLLGPTSEGAFKKVLVRSIHTNRVPVDSCNAGVSCCLCIRSVKRKDPLKRNHLRRGMVLVGTDVEPMAYRSFTAKVLILHHASTISTKYQAVIHCGIVRQSAAITEIAQQVLRTGDKSQVTFRFMSRPEYVKEGQIFIFREGSTKGVGRIVACSEPFVMDTC
eukprot:gb/GEZN01003214.1/.p1 GENE.gb/GEZN01003214.1/~~gb/GEZN01003214.1/.p1  ORF type:complete len:628 (+),score=104.06 gb/GEZN01003214.1/:103-1986(+)